jgi:beta-mannanase
VCQGIIAAATPPPVNATADLRFGVSVAGGPLSNEVNVAAISANESPSIVSTYKDWKSSFSSSEVQAVYAAGAQPMITWEPWDASAGVANQPSYKLSTIYSGQHDAYINSWITAIKAESTPKPILFRFAHEMNGNWYPWGSGVNGNVAGTYDSTNHYATGDYAKAWRYIHNKFTAAGVDSSKVQWIFSTNNTSSNGEELWNYWPGAQYVDYNGVSGFNWGTKGGPMTWQQPWDVFGGSLWHLNNDADIKGKPIIVTETASAPTEGANTQSKWINDLVNWLGTDPSNANVVGFVYFDQQKIEEGGNTIDWRFSSTTDGSKAMKDALAARPK